MLYNFHDSPADLYLRMRLNVKLNEELGTRIWSFPMRYQPTDCQIGPYRREMDTVPAAFHADHFAGDAWRGQRRPGLLQACFRRHRGGLAIS